MNDPTTVRLTALCADLARLADTVAPLAAQLELEYLIGRLERLIDDLRGAELAARVWARQAPSSRWLVVGDGKAAGRE